VETHVEPTEYIGASEELEFGPDGIAVLPQDRFFDPARIAISAAAKELVAEIARQLVNYEDYYGLRQRKRRPDDQVTFDITVEALVCDMIAAHLEGDERGTAIPLSNKVLGSKSRYRPRAFSKALPAILSMMAAPEMDFIRIQKGRKGDWVRRGQRTLMWPGKRLLSRIEQYALTEGDTARAPFAETIILKAEKHGFWDDGGYLDYEDNAETRRFRAELAEINNWISEADISVERPKLKTPRKVPVHQRQMQRVFTRGSFKSGGRLFGGFWQSLERLDRLKALRVGGEDVVELDYGQMAPRILYGLKGTDPGPRDLYDIPGIPHGHRDGVKKLFNAMLFATKPLERKPRGTKTLLPPAAVQELCSFIAGAHPIIADQFHRGTGHVAQFVESSLMVHVLLALKREGVVALQVHDGLLVPASAREIAQTIMEQAAKDIAGIPIPVSISS